MKKLNKNISSSALAEFLKLPHFGENILLTAVGAIDENEEGLLSFSKKPVLDFSGCVFAPEGSSKSLIQSEVPRLSFALALQFLVDNNFLNAAGENHFIHESVLIGKNVTIEQGVIIDENSFIDDNSIIRSNVKIGKNCRIGPGSIIGNRGFGYERDEHGNPQFIQHVGGVVIGDHVHIGALTTVPSGTLKPTKIGSYAKIDDHVHFGHNCEVGEASILTACSEYSGGVKIGNRVWVGPNVSIKEKLEVGDNAFIGIGSVVLKNVEPNTVVVGNPGRNLRKT